MTSKYSISVAAWAVAAPICAIFCVSPAAAQLPGVCPAGASDAQTLQFAGRVRMVDAQTWTVDFSRHVVVKERQTLSEQTLFSEAGALMQTETRDADGHTESKTVYQYNADGTKRVSTTYDAQGRRSLQTLYAHTADGYLARMRFTDASAVTISTTEVSITPAWTATQETFKDGEVVTTTYYYNAARRLERTLRTDGHSTRELRLRLGREGFPQKGSFTADDGTRQELDFEYEFDSRGNWTRKTTYADGKAVEVVERTIEYY